MISLKQIYFISAQNEPCISCTQNHCVQRTKHEFPDYKIDNLLDLLLDARRSISGT